MNNNRNWEALSMKDRASFIKLAIQNGYRDLDSIRSLYNNKSKEDVEDFSRWKKQIKNYKGIDVDNDATYDYRGFYFDNPDNAWKLLKDRPDAHFTDKFKTSKHPTFSNESIYSGVKHQYNPNGIKGGKWLDDYNYIMSDDMLKAYNYDISNTRKYLDEAESQHVNVYAPDGSIIMEPITVTNKYATGGPTKDSARLEYVMRESEGVDGAPYKAGSIRGMSKASKALHSDNIPTDRGKSNNNAYTGVVFTRSWNNPNYNPDVRDEYMLADANELKSVLGYEPVDFVDAYVYNKTPFRQLGIFEDKDSGEKRILRNVVKEGTNPKIYQTYPDTINKKTVRYLDKQLKKGIPNPGDNVRVIKSSNYPGLFNLEGTNLNYDGQKVSVVHVKQPDGKIAYKLVDLYDFAPDTWTTPMLLPKAKEGLQYIDENGNPYIMTSPWFYKEEWDKDIEKEFYKKALGGPLYNQNNPIESFKGNPYIPVVRY